MLDIKKIKENPDAVKAGLRAKEVDCDAVIDKILELDVKVRSLKTSTETRTAEKNRLSKENGKLFGQKKGAEKRGEDVSAIDAQIAANMAASVEIDNAIEGDKASLKVLDEELYVAMLSLPNLPDSDLLPGGKENNEPLRYIGQKHSFDFEPKHHVDLCQDLGLIDYERGVKLAGSGNWMYTGMGARLHGGNRPHGGSRECRRRTSWAGQPRSGSRHGRWKPEQPQRWAACRRCRLRWDGWRS